MKEETKKKNVLTGIDIPKWYLELEPKLLEQMELVAKYEEKLNTTRKFIYEMMTDGCIDSIKSGLVTITRTSDSVIEKIQKDKLKDKFPDIYAKFVEKSIRKGGITVKLTGNKQ